VSKGAGGLVEMFICAPGIGDVETEMVSNLDAQ
jgi:hypothetical protein